MKFFVSFFAIIALTISTMSAQAPTFADFLAQFPKASFPYTFGEEQLQSQLAAGKTAKAPRLDWSYYQFLPELERSAAYSNMPVHPEPVAALETEEFHAVVYNVARGLARNSKTYSISIFDKQGNYVGTHYVAGVNAKNLTAATITEDLKVEVKSYKVDWATTATEGKKVTGLTFVDGQTFELAAPGNPDQIEWVSQTSANMSGSEIAKMK
ncbi:MAG: hypothetical protein IT269_02965 [Saprospiraceae bacterium]|nr:hypothetical protein [Saprospiraceae bacterium]